jgi:ABC-type sugar transport system substrate-binding protein
MSEIKKLAGRILVLLTVLSLAFALSSCMEDEPEPEPVIQVPYYIGIVLKSSESETSEMYKNEIAKKFAALETEEAAFRIEVLYSEDDFFNQEHNVNQLIAEGMDCVFVEPVSVSTTSTFHDQIIESGGTIGIILGSEIEEGALDENFVFNFDAAAGMDTEVRQAVEKAADLILPKPEPEEGAEGEQADK